MEYSTLVSGDIRLMPTYDTVILARWRSRLDKSVNTNKSVSVRYRPNGIMEVGEGRIVTGLQCPVHETAQVS